MNTERKTKSMMSGLRLMFAAGALALTSAVQAQSISDYESVPPLLAESATPLVMLALSNDHQLFYKAFTDYDDLDGDDIPDTGYTHSIEYVGYYDSYKCYVYDNTAKYFYPISYSATKYCDRTARNQWSGNFLNWASMTRIDEIRKVLYGGLRYNEAALSGKTILERSTLPNDAHSFVKYYNGTDLADLTPFGNNTPSHANVPTGIANSQASGLSICNTTVDTDTTTDNSSSVDSPPLLRVVAGNYHLWAANERWQCRYAEEKSASNNNDSAKTGIYAAASNPSTSAKAVQRDGSVIGDYVARVEVCKPALLGTEDCKQYPNGNYKPIGILQQFGDSGQVHFGLMSGSYKKNKSGGVLRKDVGDITDEVNVDTDGSFKAGAGGIIETVNLFRIANYNYSDGLYNNTDNCPWDKSYFSDGSCTSWGNPFSEIMLECYRYFAGKQPSAAFDADDSTVVAGLQRDTSWSVPLTQDNLCAKMNVIAFNASTSSYDSDALAGFSDLNPESGATAKTMTNKVGNGEGITGGSYFVGENGTDNNQLCTSKTVSALGDVKGTCPDAPRLQGSYQIAGMAYHSRVNDIRTDLNEDQVVQTYGVALSPAVPNVTIPVPGSSGKTVKILPACRATMSDGTQGNCGLVDFKIVENYAPTGNAGEYKGSFYVNWEDNEQGGDYDMDMFGMIRYTITATELKVETEVIYETGSVKLGFGFVVSGTTADGFNVFSGINGYTGFNCSNCNYTDGAKSQTFTVGSSVASLLEQPLYYAAKWGGFTDVDGDGTPNLPEEWDQKNNNTGALGPDGKPDTYFHATNPKLLKSQLTNILVNILDRTASGTSAAVVTNTGTGEGAIFQALYNPRFAAKTGADAVDWVGTLNALFIDRYGHIREDSADPKGQLTDADNVVDVYYDPVGQKTKIQRYQLAADGTVGSTVGTPQDVSDIKPIWSAREELSDVVDYTTQRAVYNSNAKLGRYILSAVDQDGDGQIGFDKTLDESIPFISTYFAPTHTKPWFRLLGLKSADALEGPKIVNYIRGAAVPGYRNRRIDTDGDGSVEPVLLGDIINSSPLAVGRPSAAYDLTFGDDTYREFRQQYQNRRQMVYVGANDGMLHAFNGGFYDANTSTYKLQNTTEVAHPLGSELWAYVPYNALPHLQWLKEVGYPHVYFMDGSVKQYDVNIFPDDAKHPGGWGTILVAGMRFGGGDYRLDPEEDADGDVSDDITLRSSYVVLDITDPESAPVLLAEITHPDMGYTTAEPTMVKMREADPLTGSYATPNVNEWFLVFGSGPAGASATGREAALRKAQSEKSAKLFVFDLKTHALDVVDTNEGQSFVGGITTADWTRNYMDDAIYFGSVTGTPANPAGELHRGLLSLNASGKLNIAVSDVMDVINQPFAATPLTVRDREGEYWIYAGTGRFYVVEDNFSTTQQSYYGVKERQTNRAVAGTELVLGDLINTTDIKVYTDGSIDSKSNPGADIFLDGATRPAQTFIDVVDAVIGADGWYFNFARTRSRNLTQAAVSDNSLVFTEYQPSGLKCQPEGFGFLNAPHLLAGVPGSFGPLGTDSSSVNSDGAEEVKLSESLGLGSPSGVSVHQRGDGKKVAVVQSSTGELTTTTIEAGASQGTRESWKELIIDWK